jgi:DNA-binding NarL/FixJ family response regulator
MLELLATLTPKERRVVHALIDGKPTENKPLARRLGVSEATIQNRLNSIYEKWELQSRTQVAVFVLTGYRPAAAAKG